jgi:hypothetical protein
MVYAIRSRRIRQFRHFVASGRLVEARLFKRFVACADTSTNQDGSRAFQLSYHPRAKADWCSEEHLDEKS